MITPLSVKKIELSEKKSQIKSRATPLEEHSSSNTTQLLENTLVGMGSKKDFSLNKQKEEE